METEQQQQQQQEQLRPEPAPAASLPVSSPPLLLPPPPPPSPPRRQRRVTVSYHVTVTSAAGHAPPPACASQDACYCFTVLTSFWFFASLTAILGLYGSVELHLGPNSSWLLKANSVFIQGIKVEAVDGSKPGAALYGFFQSPPLDISTTWTEAYNLSLAANLHQEFAYYLNEGAEIDITYHVRAPRSPPLIFAITRGKESLIEWIEDPSYDRGTLSWSLIHGNGSIRQAISKPSDYYISFGNIHRETVEVHVNFSIRALLYNTSDAYYSCSINQSSSCVMNLFPFMSDAAVLTTPAAVTGEEIDEWDIKVSYNPRWITYFAGSGAVTVMVVLSWKLITSQLRPNPPPSAVAEAGNDERTPLLATNKDDDELSLGSSYDSVSSDEGGEPRPEEAALRSEAGEGEVNRPQQLCAICFDAPKESFFLPCGHCATCFACGTRIAEEDGICPICRRKVKKVRRIITV